MWMDGKELYTIGLPNVQKLNALIETFLVRI